MTRVFIDGSAGTTGLTIQKRLSALRDFSVTVLTGPERKDPEARRRAMAQSDVTFLCLPDDAAREAAELSRDLPALIIDTSTAHRLSDDWVYGFPELPGQAARIAGARRIANPGCHASGFIALVAPLVRAGILSKDVRLSCFSLTGYSGGGRKMIEAYQDPNRRSLYQAPRQYALNQTHKHLPEMAAHCGLTHAPAFSPVVGDFFSGMEVTVPLFSQDVSGTLNDVREVLRRACPGPIVRYTDTPDEDGFLSALALSGRDDMLVSAFGNDERMLLVSRFDNLGKGACGAAIQNMNLALGRDPREGLILPDSF